MMSGLVWILVSLLAIGVLEDSSAGGIALALLGGVALGLIAVIEMRDNTSVPKALPAGSSNQWVDWIAAKELWILLLLGPFFILPQRSLAPVLAVVPLLGILRWRAQGRLTKRTPLDIPILLLLVMLLVSVLVSSDQDRSLPKLAGVLWGIAVYYAIVNRISSAKSVEWLTLGLAGVGSVVAAAAFLGTEWVVSSKTVLNQIYALLPGPVIKIPGTILGQIHPNETAGSLAFLVPFLLALLVMQWEKGGSSVENDRWEARFRGFFLSRRGLLVLLILPAVVLTLTLSRSALFGVAVAVLVLCAVRWRRLRWVIPIGILAVVVLGAIGGTAFIGSALVGSGGPGGVGTLDFAGRQEVWQRAVYAIQDYPYTGLGLNMFDPALRLLYPLFHYGPDFVMEHAHNNFLQVSVDLGIPGLLAYVALLTSFGCVTGSVYFHSPSPFIRAVALGLGLGMLAHQIFGLTDAITLGSKPGIIFWVMLAVAAGLWRRTLPNIEDPAAVEQ
jgi:putative inorganic carbon (HCO3(-)) transporter